MISILKDFSFCCVEKRQQNASEPLGSVTVTLMRDDGDRIKMESIQMEKTYLRIHNIILMLSFQKVLNVLLSTYGL